MNSILRRFYMPDDNDFGGLFDDEVLETAVKKTEYTSNANPDFYQPSNRDEKAKNGIYKATLRFLPFHLDVPNSKISKKIYYFDVNDEKSYVDCMSNFPEQKGKKNIITESYFKYYKSDSATLRSLVQPFKRKEYYWALVQVIKDEQHPELEGKILIWRFSFQVDDLISKQGEEAPGRSKVNVFNPFTGKDFYLDIREKTMIENGQEKKLTTYENSYFAENRTTIQIDGKNIEKTPENQAVVQKYLSEKSPDLTQVKAKPWTEEEELKVIGIVRDIFGGHTAEFDAVYKAVYGKSYFEGKANERNENEKAMASTAAPAKEDKKADTATPAAAADVKSDMANKLENKTEEKAAATPAAAEANDEDNDDFSFELDEMPG